MEAAKASGNDKGLVVRYQDVCFRIHEIGLRADFFR